jgi:hypothetical protein
MLQEHGNVRDFKEDEEHLLDASRLLKKTWIVRETVGAAFSLG